ncbi:MAG: DUF1801 domain-containing protein [Chlamydiales bacterium]|nr:DUF1801 domain-containing protein [Chlamydiales bacterium]NCF71224.1 DUF1801 domain-containing protein [Chlamydiales bacterium]
MNPPPEEVLEVINSYPKHIQKSLLKVRELIFKIAEKTKEVGHIEEALRWGEPSYLTSKSKSGSTIRLAYHSSLGEYYALHFNCKTTLIDSFKLLYPDTFSFKGNRSILLHYKDPLAKKELSHCLLLALTYHINKDQI